MNKKNSNGLDFQLEQKLLIGQHLHQIFKFFLAGLYKIYSNLNSK